ncbi:hypothetical protein V8C37DRAFT_381249 [Trichoderma ceciliae]
MPARRFIMPLPIIPTYPLKGLTRPCLLPFSFQLQQALHLSKAFSPAPVELFTKYNMATKAAVASATNGTNGTSKQAAVTQAGELKGLREDGNGKVNLLAVLTHDGKNTKQIFMSKLARSDVEGKRLANLRDIMTASRDKKEYAALNFCTKDGAVVDDDWTIKDYLADVEETDGGSHHRIYLKRKCRGADDIEKMDISSVDLTLSSDARFLKNSVTEDNDSSIKKADSVAAKGAEIDAPADLSENDWAVVVDNNNLCYGLTIVRQKDGNKTIPVGITRARFPAFYIKDRRLRESNLSAVEVKNKDVRYRIPDFIVDDRSYVSIYETHTQFQSSLANSSFSEWDVAASRGGSVFGAPIGASAGYEIKSGSHSAAVGQSKPSHLMNISYNFPRVQLILDQYSLELTDECKEQLIQVRDEDDMTKFLDLYGEFFSTRVQLGGRLYASEAYDSKRSSNANETLKSMKAQAAASFKAGHGSCEGGKHQDSNSETHSTLQWQANGGDTLLSTNPPQWCPTVAPFTNWRITKRDGNCHIIDFIAGYRDQERLRQFVKEKDFNFLEYNPDPVVLERPLGDPPKFYLRTELKVNDWRYLRLGQTNHSIDGIDTPTKLAVMRDWAIDSNMSGKYFILEDIEGRPVYEPCYGEPYFMKNPSSGYYLTIGNGYMIAGDSRRIKHFIVFRGNAGRESGPIQNSDDVVIRLRNSEAWHQAPTLLYPQTSDTAVTFLTNGSGAEAVFNFRLKSFGDATFGEEEDLS